MKNMNRMGQQAVMGLIVAFMLVATAAILQGPLISFIAIGVNASMNTTHGSLIIQVINLLPVFIWLIVLVATVALITGSQR